MIKINYKVKKGNSFEENDYYNRLQYWDYSKNGFLPSEISKKSSKKVWFKCKNNHSFRQVLSDTNSGKWCNICSCMLKESKMASTLKQVLIKIFPNSIWEYDIGFKGEKGGKSPYDIYIPELNLLIECQSEYHLDDEQVKLDICKKEYALKNGYYYFDISSMDFSPLQALKVFIPSIDKIPEYVDYTLNTRIQWDLKKAQYYLDNTDMSQKQIAEYMNIPLKRFYYAIHSGLLVPPKSKRIKTSIVKLSLEGEFLEEFDSIADIKRKYNYFQGNIVQCCKNKMRSYKGFMWTYKEDYLYCINNNIKIKTYKDKTKDIIAKTNIKKFKSIIILKDNSILYDFSSVKEAIEVLNMTRAKIDYKLRHNYYKNGIAYMYKSDYEEILNKYNTINESIIKEYKNNKYL